MKDLDQELAKCDSFDNAGFRPGSRATFVAAKVAKTINAQTGFIGWDRREP